MYTVSIVVHYTRVGSTGVEVTSPPSPCEPATSYRPNAPPIRVHINNVGRTRRRRLCFSDVFDVWFSHDTGRPFSPPFSSGYCAHNSNNIIIIYYNSIITRPLCRFVIISMPALPCVHVVRTISSSSRCFV